MKTSTTKTILYTILVVAFTLLLPMNAIAKKGDKEKFVVVIDAGHGGKDTGAVANGGKEKDINLAVSLKVGKLISQRFPNVTVIYTRKDDTFIGLYQRAKLANKKKANLFISIHTNSAKSSSASGVETYVLGLWRNDDNLQVAMKENESILLEENYELNYQGFDPASSESYIIFELLQNKYLEQSIKVAQSVQKELSRLPLINRGVRQAGFLVIRETAMPSILIELGFISNRSDAQFLLSDSGQKKLANAIVEGFGEYYRIYNKNFGLPTIEKRGAKEESKEEETIDSTAMDSAEESIKTATQEKETPTPNKAKISQETYRIQILASKRKVPTNSAEFKGEKVRREQKGNMYCYTVDAPGTLEQAKKQLNKYKKRFKGAHIVVYQNGVRKREIY